MEKERTDEIEIDVRELFLVLFSKWYILFLSMILGGLALYLVSITLIPKEFESSTSIYVLNRQDENVVTYNDLQSGTQLTKDYAQLVKSRSVTEKVIAQLRLNTTYQDMQDIDYEDLSEMISVENTTDTRIIRISVRDTNPGRAQDIANAVREAASVHIQTVMDIEAVNVVDYAEMPMEQVSPNLLLNIVLGAGVFFVLAASCILLIHILDDTIKDPDDVENYLGLSVLANIPMDESLKPKGKRKKA